MELEHSFTVPVPMDRVWDVLLDVERVAPCMPGASLDSVDGDEIRGRIKVKVGPINMTYAGTARFVERDRATGVVRLEASGKETRGAGTAAATVRSVLEDRGDETAVVVLTTLNVTGKPAQFGRGVMNEVGGRLLGIFASNLAAALAEQDAPSAEQIAAASAGEAEATVPAPDAAHVPEDHTADVLDAPLGDLMLPARAAASLRREGIATVGQLASKTRDELLAIDGIGPASVDDISAKLAERRLALGQPAVGATSVAASIPAQPTAQGRAAVPAQAGNGSRTGGQAVAAARAMAHQQDDAINLFKVAGLPLLKRAAPVLAGLAAVLVIGLRRRMRRRR